jgi:hypothetical protein
MWRRRSAALRRGFAPLTAALASNCNGMCGGKKVQEGIGK